MDTKLPAAATAPQPVHTSPSAQLSSSLELQLRQAAPSGGLAGLPHGLAACSPLAASSTSLTRPLPSTTVPQARHTASVPSSQPARHHAVSRASHSISEELQLGQAAAAAAILTHTL